ncbi:MAG: hypothetical protein EA001_06965 [Oscillatoriales cyanobacterium]|nr:MAG: hypothetical protein EA001_06965 [Oscillatoriales cyanobacterium]
MSYLFKGLIWLFFLWLALVGVGYSIWAALLLAAFGGAAGAIISVWWAQPAGEPVIPRRTFERVERAPQTYAYETLQSSRQKRLGRRRRRQTSWLDRWLVRQAR